MTTSEAYNGPQVTSDYWPPDYIGIKNGRLDIVRKHETCPDCRRGNHRLHMRDDRCLRAVDPVPHDFVCRCKVTR